MKRESKGGGYLDFSYSAIPHEFAGASRDPLHNESPMLFILYQKAIVTPIIT